MCACTHCDALCSAALHDELKKRRKNQYSGDKTELRKEHRRFGKMSKRPPPRARVQSRDSQPRNARGGLLPPRRATLAPRGSCGVLLVVSPPSCLQSRTPRVAADVSMFQTFLWEAVGAFDFGRMLLMPCPANTSERPELRAVVVSAAATLRAAVIYTGLATAHASATKSSSVGDSRARTTQRPDPTHARAARR